MLFPQPLKRGVLVRRYKRFLADVMLDGADVETTVHTPNPGAMLGLSAPGMTVWCSHSGSATRKLPLTWELVEADGGVVGINTMAPNRLVAEALAAGAIAELHDYPLLRREVKYGAASRIDFLLEHPGRPPCWLEVKSSPTLKQQSGRLWLEIKNCHLTRGSGLAEFPDCVAARSARHLRELEGMVAAGDRAAVLFVVQRMDCDRFSAARDLDPKFAIALDQAADAGVEVLVYGTEITTAGIRLTGRMPWIK
jgi:sugar fermentation stimulation protein A